MSSEYGNDRALAGDASGGADPDHWHDYEIQQRVRSARHLHLVGQAKRAMMAYGMVLQGCPQDCAARVGLAQLHMSQQQLPNALKVLLAAPDGTELSAEYHYLIGCIYQQQGKLDLTRKHFAAALELTADFPEIHNFMARDQLSAPMYRDFLAKLHECLKPGVYLEIGINWGDSFVLSGDCRLSIGIDPAPDLRHALLANMRLFKMPSDSFFALPQNRQLLEENPLDMCFVDGLHQFGQALRDIFNAEAYSRPGSVILVHDAIPFNEVTATPERRTMFWSGDVWKAIVALKESCPDLRIETLPCPPTGLCVITDLKPDRQLGPERIEAVVRRFVPLAYDHIAQSKDACLNVVSDWEAVLDRLAPAASATGSRT